MKTLISKQIHTPSPSKMNCLLLYFVQYFNSDSFIGSHIELEDHSATAHFTIIQFNRKSFKLRSIDKSSVHLINITITLFHTKPSIKLTNKSFCLQYISQKHYVILQSTLYHLYSTSQTQQAIFTKDSFSQTKFLCWLILSYISTDSDNKRNEANTICSTGSWDLCFLCLIVLKTSVRNF